MAGEQSQEIGEIAGALARAQMNLGKVVADKSVKNKDGSLRYRYADLADALEACRSTLNAEGIAVLQLPSTSERNGIEVTTRLVHESGQWITSGPLFMPVSGGAQDVGSAITYARRYQLLAMVGLSPEDDDGQKAQVAKPESWGRSEPRHQKRPSKASRPPAAKPRQDLGSTTRGQPLINAIECRLGLLGEDLAKSWASALAGAEIDTSAYANAWPDRAHVLSFDDGAKVAGWLKLELGRRGIDEDPAAGGAP